MDQQVAQLHERHMIMMMMMMMSFKVISAKLYIDYCKFC